MCFFGFERGKATGLKLFFSLTYRVKLIGCKWMALAEQHKWGNRLKAVFFSLKGPKPQTIKQG